MNFIKFITLIFVNLILTFTLNAKTYNEAPELAKLVKAGKLPSVEERLPDNPVIVGPGREVDIEDLPNWEVGKYGGVFRSISRF